MKFDELYNKLMTENDASDYINRGRYNNSIDIIDSYRGGMTKVAVLVGDENSSETVEGINGDGSDEFTFSKGFEDVVNYGKSIGLWKEQDTEQGPALVVVDSDKWDQFYDGVINDDPDSGDDEYEYRGWPGDGSGEDDFADYNQMEGNDY
jgi:hypothetical protein